MTVYRRREGEHWLDAHDRVELGEVVVHPHKDPTAITFRCPCDRRDVYVTQPPHDIRFTEDGRLHLGDGSCGARPTDEYPQANWCHFFVRDGVAEMVGDSVCPGKDL